MIYTNNYKVYYHKVPKEISGYDYDKYYIGITCRKYISDRWGKNGKGYKTQLFYKAIQKYGWDNIEHRILFENLSAEQAQTLEMALIQALDSQIGHKGYNNTMGGEGIRDYDKTNNRNIYCLELNAAFKNIEIASSITGVNKYTIRNRCKFYENGILQTNKKDDFHFCYIEQMYKMYPLQQMSYSSKPIVVIKSGKIYGSRNIANKILGTKFTKRSILDIPKYLKKKSNNTLYNKDKIMFVQDYLKLFDHTYFC